MFTHYLDTRKVGKFIYESYEFNYEPFYIGKGFHKNRLNTHFQPKESITDGNQLKQNIISKIKIETGNKPLSLVVTSELFENDAFDLEIKLIKLIGRRDLKMGPLSNLTDGGEGASGYKMSQETKNKISEKTKGEHNAMFGKTHTEEIRKYLSDIRIGKKHSEETIQKYRDTRKKENNAMFGKTHTEETLKILTNHSLKYEYEIIDPSGNSYFTDNLYRFCIDNNLNNAEMNKSARGIVNHHKNWTVKILNKL